MPDRDTAQLLKDKEVNHRIQGLLYIFGDEELRLKNEVVSLMLHDPVNEVRARAAWVLDKLNQEDTLPFLLKALHDPCWHVRSNAGWGLVHLGKGIEKQLREFIIHDEDEDAVAMARLVLDRL